MCFLGYYKERDITADTNWWQLLVHIYAHLSTEAIRQLTLGVYPIFSGKFLCANLYLCINLQQKVFYLYIEKHTI